MLIVTFHGESLSSSCLTISKYGSVVSLQHTHHNLLGTLLEYHILLGGLTVSVIKRELSDWILAAYVS